MGKTFRHAVLGFASAAFLGGALAPAASAETLTDALISAYKNSRLLEQNQALLRAADENVAQSIAALRPVLQFIAEATNVDTPQISSNTSGTVSLQASMALFDGGSNRMAVEAAKESVLSARASLVGVEQNVLLTAVQAYMDVRASTQNVSLAQNNVRLISEQLRAAQDRFDVGEVTRTDVSLAESRLATAQSNLVAAEGALTSAREVYRTAVGHYPPTLTGTPRVPTLPKTLADARAIAVRGHPSIISAQHDVTAAEISIARAKAARGPSVSATAAASRTDGGNDSSSVGLELRQTLYSGGALVSVQRQAAANRDASRAALHRSVQLVEQDVGQSWSGLAVSRSQLLASDQRIRAAQLAFEGTQEEARLGSRTTLDVLDAEQELLDARTGRVDAETNQFIAYYSVLASMGLLTVEHLNLGIPTYDPTAYYNAVRNAPLRSIQGEQLDRVLKNIGRE
ncbi:transporter [Rhodovulum sp. NI22]|nr:transporter [Rhodovulum sp. NI22]